MGTGQEGKTKPANRDDFLLYTRGLSARGHTFAAVKKEEICQLEKHGGTR
jgi:hypothetical protein